jgi:hypothetical protein
VTLGSVTVTAGAAGITFDGTSYSATNGAAGISSTSIAMSSAAQFPVICNGLLALGSITASAGNDNGNIHISWQTTSDDKIQEYDIERSFDTTGFATIATLSANNSSYIDLSPGNQTLYYRIREMDINGNYLYSNIVAIKQAAWLTGPSIAPNPTTGSATLRFMSDRNTLMSVGLFDMTGNRVWYTQIQAISGMNILPIDHLQQLPNGMYIVQLNNGENNENVKVFIRH